MRNTKVKFGENSRNEHLNNFMVKLKNSGYNEKYQKQILESAYKGFEKYITTTNFEIIFSSSQGGYFFLYFASSLCSYTFS